MTSPGRRRLGWTDRGRPIVDPRRPDLAAADGDSWPAGGRMEGWLTDGRNPAVR